MHGERYDYTRVEYKSVNDLVLIVCGIHGPFLQTPYNHCTKGQGCPKCGNDRIADARTRDLDWFLKKAGDTHGDLYDYSRVVYRGAHTKVEILCREHGSFEQTPASHYAGNGCPRCGDQRSAAAKFKERDEIIARARAAHGDRYDYSDLVYTGINNEITVICPVHGGFRQSASSHCRGHGCPQCGAESSNDAKRIDPLVFLRRARQVHGHRYNYRGSHYVSNDTKLDIVCPEHGAFSQTPSSHLSGAGCPACGYASAAAKNRQTAEEFISRAMSVHGSRYDYSLVDYSLARSPVVIVCPDHGPFEQTPSHHLRGSECPKCHAVTSRAEDDLFAFVSNLAPDAERSNRKIIRPKELDIYVPSRNLAIEYCGLFWHSEYKGKGKDYHLAKHEACESKGIRLVTIFEDEWRDKQEIVKATIRHLLGGSEKGCYARNAVVREISWQQAKVFLATTHLLGPGTAGTHRIGAFDPSGSLIAVMVFGSPSDERGATDVVEMKRFATDKKNNPGIGSKMFKWAVARYGFKHVTAFVDRRWFTGEFKRHTGFSVAGCTGPALFWTDFAGRYHRRFKTKKELCKVPQFEGRDLAKSDMMRELGLYRIWDCGKLRLEWRP